MKAKLPVNGPSSTSGTPRALDKALVKLNHDLAGIQDNLDSAFRIITECAARELKVHRCSLWLYSDNRERLICRDLYTAANGLHTSGIELKASEYPNYFFAIGAERIIAAHDALTDPNTREFAETYLGPLDIRSMLDAPIRVRGNLVGVVCHEHTTTARRWTLGEQSFAASVGDFAAQAMESVKLFKSRKALEKAQKIAQMGTWTLDVRTGRWTFSKEMARILGHEHVNTLTGLDAFLKHIHDEDRSRVLEAVHRAKSGTSDSKMECRLRTLDEGERLTVMHFEYLADDEGVHTLNGTCHDVTELSLMRREEAARHQLEIANEALLKSQNALKKTLAALAHDVRTPIAALKIGLGRLGQDDVDLAKAAPALRAEVEYLDALFANMVALVRMESKTSLEPQTRTDLNPVLERVSLRFQFLAQDKGIDFAYSDPGEDLHVLTDSVEFEQAAGNVIHNAVKYARQNVAVLLYRDQDEAVLEVRDDGPGFLDSEIDHVRTAFFSGDTHPTYGRKGMGLGLAIVDDLVARVNGKLTLTNHSEGGGMVTIRLPLLGATHVVSR